MKKFVIFTVLMLLIGVHQGMAQEGAFTKYHSTDYFLTSSGAMEFGLNGYANPALLKYNDRGGMILHWSGRRDKEDEQWKHLAFDDWGMYFAGENGAFGFSHHKIGEKSVTDYMLSFSAGSRELAFGSSIGWSNGDVKFFDRKTILKYGVLYRPMKYVSVGLTGTKALKSDRMEGVADLAVRPFGNEKLALFGDYSIQDHVDFEDGNWSAGVAIEALPGIRLTGRYFDTEAVSAGLNISFGHSDVTSQSHYIKNEETDDVEYSHTSYAVRIGGYDRNILGNMFQKESYLKMDLKDGIKYQSHSWFDDSETLMSILNTIDSAKDNDNIKGIVINTSGFPSGEILPGISSKQEMLWEVREKLKEFQSTGKEVLIYLDDAGLIMYHFASVADRVILDPMGGIVLPGIAFGKTYVKGTLEKLGVGFDEWRYFKYKSAAETFSREDMSEGDREQNQKLIEDFYEFFRGEICDSRGLSIEEFDNLVNEEVFFLPEVAVEKGLVDEISHWEDIEDMLKENEDDEPPFVDASFLKMMELPADNRWGERPKIAVIYALGECAMDHGIKARKLVKDVKKAKDDPSIKAIVFRVDSPGGSALASDIVAKMLKECKEEKPVIISQGFLAASGGYWLSMYGDEIVAGPNTITGSIGVIGGWLYNDGIKEDMGMTTDIVKIGDHADLGFGFRIPFIGLGLPDRNLSDEERAKVEASIKGMYKDFVKKVAEGRDMDFDAIDEIGQGRIWSGITGKEIGLVDEIGGLEKAIEIAKDRAGIEDDYYEIVELPKIAPFNPEMLKPKLLGIDVSAKDQQLLNHLKARVESNGKPMPVLPLDYMMW